MDLVVLVGLVATGLVSASDSSLVDPVSSAAASGLESDSSFFGSVGVTVSLRNREALSSFSSRTSLRRDFSATFVSSIASELSSISITAVIPSGPRVARISIATSTPSSILIRLLRYSEIARSISV